MAGINPFANLAPMKGKPAAKGKPAVKKPMSAASAKAVASFVKGKPAMPMKKMPMDAEDMKDGGVDEATEKK